jgi:GTP-binding protein Era
MKIKSGYISLIGLPNAGKSTLVNALVGEKVGIVSAKPQTTRRRVIGVYNDENMQACFIDAPGKIKADEGLNHFLEKEYQAVLQEGDVILAVLNLDAKRIEDLLEIAQAAAAQKKPWLAVITKTDLDPGFREAKLRTELLSLGLGVPAAAVAVSATKNPTACRERLLPFIQDVLREGPPLFDRDTYTTQSEREMAAEIIREKCFESVHQEVPYGLAVQILKFDEGGRIPRIHAEIVVAKESFVPIILGEQGRRIRHIGVESRKDIEKVLGKQVYLETHVKVKRDWSRNPTIMKELGYVAEE